MVENQSSGPVRYAQAILAMLAALVLRQLLTPLLGDLNPYHTVWLAVAFSAWFCGLGPSILSTVLGAVGVWYLFLPPIHSFVHGRSEIFGTAAYLAFAAAIIALGQSNQKTASSRFLLAAIVDSSDDGIISKNLDGFITSWNGGAERIFEWKAEEVIGKSITIIIPPELLPEETEIQRRMRAGERIDHFETIRVTKTGVRVHLSLTISPLRNEKGKIIGISKIARNITERRELQTALRDAHETLEKRVRQRTAELWEKNEELVKQQAVVRQLSARLLRLRDEERRRIARELHDSTGQLLAAISMNIGVISNEREKLGASAQACLDESDNLVKEVSREVRTISYLLHPPQLEEAGLASAIRWYIEGFAERGKIETVLDMPTDFQRYSNELEISLFRVVQECLTNVHLHSGATKAEVRITRDDGYINLEVSDDGKGIPLEKQMELNSSETFGVGVRGMRERMRQFGGSLEIRSSKHGTVVTAHLPVEGHNRTTAT